MIKKYIKKLVKKYSRYNPFISKSHIHIIKNKFFNIKNLNIEQLKLNLLIIGAQKSGTTSLHNYLNLHPNIFMSHPLKEPGIYLDFVFIKNYLKNSYNINVESQYDLLKNFMLQGYKGERYFGESSSYYTLGERAKIFNVPENIKKNNPNTKFIYIVRNPLYRIVSNYLHEKMRNLTQLDLNHHVMNKNPKLNDNNSLSTSLYFKQISNYIEHFNKEQFKIVLFEKSIRDSHFELNEIFSFLSLPHLNKMKNLKIYNKSKNREIYKQSELLFSEAVYKYLMSFICDDISKFQQFTGINLDVWDLSKRKWCRKQFKSELRTYKTGCFKLLVNEILNSLIAEAVLKRSKSICKIWENVRN